MVSRQWLEQALVTRFCLVTHFPEALRRNALRTRQSFGEKCSQAGAWEQVIKTLCCLTALSILFFDQANAGDQYAFLVAVREYDPNELTSLQYTENDIGRLADVLANVGYAKERVVLMTQAVGARKTRFLPLVANIKQELALLLSTLEADDSVVVAFAGHGVQPKGETGTYFCPADAKLADKKTLLPLESVYDSLKKCKAGHKVLLVDACRNDPQSRRSRSAGEVELEPVGAREPQDPPGGIISFFACSKGQQAFEDPGLERGVFFHYLCQGLEGGADLDQDEEVDLAELQKFTVKNVQTFVRNELGRLQTPELRGESRGIFPLAKLLPKRINNSLEMPFALIPAGEFLRGSGESLEDLEQAFGDEATEFGDEFPQHRVRITQPFYMSTTEVTVGMFRQFVEATNYRTTGERDGGGGGYNGATGEFDGPKPEYTWQNPGWAITDEHPVINVSWHDAQAFCTWLSRKEGKTYRLPSEAQWEYACRAGTRTRYNFGDDPELLAKHANVGDAAMKRKFPGFEDVGIKADDGYDVPAPVGQFPANAWGLHDMHGNVFEWCRDGYDEEFYKKRLAEDPVNTTLTEWRLLRGGSWDYSPASQRASFRAANTPTERDDNIGFRVIMERSP